MVDSITCLGLNQNEKEYFINLLMNIKDLGGMYKLLMLKLERISFNAIKFSGIVCKDEDARGIDGMIYMSNKIIVKTHFTISNKESGVTEYDTTENFTKTIELSKDFVDGQSEFISKLVKSKKN